METWVAKGDLGRLRILMQGVARLDWGISRRFITLSQLPHQAQGCSEAECQLRAISKRVVSLCEAFLDICGKNDYEFQSIFFFI